MITVTITVWLSCLSVVSGTDKSQGLPADIFLQRIEVQQGDQREIQKLVDATKDIPLPINCTIKYEVRPKQ